MHVSPKFVMRSLRRYSLCVLFAALNAQPGPEAKRFRAISKLATGMPVLSKQSDTVTIPWTHPYLRLQNEVVLMHKGSALKMCSHCETPEASSHIDDIIYSLPRKTSFARKTM
jgi:hypothetical protein